MTSIGTPHAALGCAPDGQLADESIGHAPSWHELTLPVRQPFDAPGVFRFLAARAVDGVESADLTGDDVLRYARTLQLPHGPAALEVIAARDSGRDWRVRLRLELSDDADRALAISLVRRLFDLDADSVAIDAALSADSLLAPLVACTPGIRVPGAVDPDELVVRAIVGQQISVAAARTHLSRLAAQLGSPHRSEFAGLERLFPSPAQIADGLPVPVLGEIPDSERPLRLPGQAIRAVIGITHALADGELKVDIGADPVALRTELLARPRVGPWTAAYIAMRVLDDPDAWLDGDVALVAGGRALGLLSDGATVARNHRALAERATAWAPWRSYASMHLWQAASSAPHATPRSRMEL